MQDEVQAVPEVEGLASTESEASNAPDLDTATNGEVEETQEKERTFTQAELDAAIQKRLLKEERKFNRRMAEVLQNQPEVKRSNFENEAEYEEARRRQEVIEAARQLREQEKAKEKQEELVESIHSKFDLARDKYPDFDHVVLSERNPVSEPMRDFFALSDVGGDLAYHLAKNPQIALEIANLPPVPAALKLASLEKEIASKPKQTPSKAPEPIKPVGQRGNTASKLPSDEDDVETWMRKERERIRSR